MKASWNIVEAEYKMLTRTLNVWAVNLYSTIYGNLNEGDVYQAYFYFEDSVNAGQYEAFTCETQYKKNVNDAAGLIRNYQTSADRSGNVKFMDDSSRRDKINTNDFDFAGWRNEFDIDVPTPKQELESNEVGCVATRIFFAHGNLLSTIKSYFPDEVDWILKFDWQKSHDVYAGWRSWKEYDGVV